MNRNLLAGTFLASALVGAAFVGAEPANAFSWDVTNREWVTINNGDSDISFDVFFYQATIGRKDVEGLNAEAKFTLDGAFDASTNQARFRVDLKNTSNRDLWASSRLSGIAFAVDPDLYGAEVDSGGTFNKALVGGKYPEGIKDVEVCYTGGGSCAGGGNAGVTLGNVGSFYTTLKFNEGTNGFNIKLDQFYARWQSLDSQKNNALGYQYKGDSGVGYGQVPTPALVPGLVGAGIAALRRRKQQETTEQVAEI